MSTTTLVVQGAGDMDDPDGTIVLVRSLDRAPPAGHRVVAPEMPNADDPRYEPWRRAIREHLNGIDGPPNCEATIPGAVVRRIPGAEHSFRDGLHELVDDILEAGQEPRPTASR